MKKINKYCNCIYRRIDNLCLHKDVKKTYCRFPSTCKMYDKKLERPHKYFDGIPFTITETMAALEFFNQIKRLLKNLDMGKTLKELNKTC